MSKNYPVTVKRWKPADDILLAEAFECGMSDRELGTLLDRTEKAISIRRTKLSAGSLRRYSRKARKMINDVRKQRMEDQKAGRQITVKSNRLKPKTEMNIGHSVAKMVQHENKKQSVPSLMSNRDVARIAKEVKVILDAEKVSDDAGRFASLLNLLIPYTAGVISIVSIWAILEAFSG